MKDYYEILEVSSNVSDEMLKKIFKLQVKKYHPDIYKGSDSENKIKEINEAYEVLSDSIKRQNYDYELNLYKEQEQIAFFNQSDLVQENAILREEIQKKEQIIRHFLGELDLSEFEQKITQNHDVYKGDINYQNYNEKSHVNNLEVDGKEDITKYYTRIIMSFLARIVGLILMLVFTSLFLSIILKQNLFEIIYNVFR